MDQDFSFYDHKHEGSNKRSRVLKINLDDFVEIAKAFSSDLRVNIFKQLLRGSMNVGEISEMFQIPASTAAVNIRKLEEVGLIRTEMVPGTRGTQKLCAAIFKRIVVDADDGNPISTGPNYVLLSMPIGNFFEFDVTPTCGLVSESSIIGEVDDPRSFYEPDRVKAQLIWFKQGYLEYRFPNRLPPRTRLTNLELSMEVCSEAPLHRKDWPSDITVSINGIEIGTWTSPGDYGGDHGLLTPDWWSVRNTQYGLFKTWRVSTEGSFIDGRKLSNVQLKDLQIENGASICVRIGVKPDSTNVGGINLFGNRFGNYETDLMMRLDYTQSM